MPNASPLENHYEKNEKDTYLSLDVLTDILEKLSASGKASYLSPYIQYSHFWFSKPRVGDC